jgi:hypothetical protein
LDVNRQELAQIFYGCALLNRDTVFRVFPSSDVSLRAAAAFRRIKKFGSENYYCLIILLHPEEEATAYQAVLLSTIQNVVNVEGDTKERVRKYRRILIDMSTEIKRRGGSRDKSMCPFLYERPTRQNEMALYCRVVKKPCYLKTYQMPGFHQCPRYIRRQRRRQLANARRIVRAGIQRILAKADEQRSQSASEQQTWSEPIHAILDHLFTFLPVSAATKDLSSSIIKIISEKRIFQGVPRQIIAASIAYLSAKEVGDNLNESDIIELVGCSLTSLRRNCRELSPLLADAKEQTPTLEADLPQ